MEAAAYQQERIYLSTRSVKNKSKGIRRKVSYTKKGKEECL